MTRLIRIFAFVFGVAYSWPSFAAGTVILKVDPTNFSTAYDVADLNKDLIESSDSPPCSPTPAPTCTGTIALTADTGSTGTSSYSVSLSFSPSVSSPWIKVISGGSGTISAGGSGATVAIQVSDPKLHVLHNAGQDYTAQIQFSGNNLKNTPSSITVTMSVSGVDVTAQSAVSISVLGGLKASQSFTVNAFNNATITVQGNQPWLTVLSPPPATNITTSASVTFQVDSAKLNSSPGVLAITCSGTPCQEVDVSVNVTVLSSASINPISNVTFNGAAGGPNPPDQMISIFTSDGSSIPVTYSTSPPNVPWLSFARTTSVPTTLDLQAAIGNMPANTYTATVTLTPSNGTSAVSFQVTLNVAAAVTISANTSALTFNAPAGGPDPSSQSVQIQSSDHSAVGIAISQSSNSGWLTVTSSSGTTPATLTVAAKAGTLAANTYTATISITPNNGSPAATVSVQFTIGPKTPTIVSDLSTLTFSANVGGSSPASQSFHLTSSDNSNIGISVVQSTSNGGNWLSYTQSSNTTPATITVTATLGSLGSGSYTGSITVTPGNGTTAQVVSVSFVVGSASPQLQLSNNSPVSLSAAAGSNTCNSPNPITVTSSIPSQVLALTVNASVSTPQGGNWLGAALNQSSTPATLTITCNPSGLAIGSYQGSVTISSSAASNSPVTINVSLSIGNITITPVSNASAGPRLSPGMIVSVYGSPIATVSQDGTYPNTTVGGTSVAVTDSAGVSRPAILFAVFPTQINLLIPAASATGNGTLTISQNGSPIASANIILYDYAPGFFTETSKPDGPAAVSALRALNGQNTPLGVLSCSSSGCVPIPIDTSVPGTVVLTLYGTGIHSPALSNVSCAIGSTDVQVMYAGPQGLAGLEQVNVVIPTSLAGAGQQTVTCSVNGQNTNSPYIVIK